METCVVGLRGMPSWQWFYQGPETPFMILRVCIGWSWFYDLLQLSFFFVLLDNINHFNIATSKENVEVSSIPYQDPNLSSYHRSCSDWQNMSLACQVKKDELWLMPFREIALEGSRMEKLGVSRSAMSAEVLLPPAKKMCCIGTCKHP